MATSTHPSLTDQQRFWNTWNATLRNPENLNQWALRRGETIIGIVRSLAECRYRAPIIMLLSPKRLSLISAIKPPISTVLPISSNLGGI